MNMENAALSEKGFIEKTLGIKTLKNGNYEITAKALPTGKSKEQVITMEFTQNGLNALVGTWMILAD